MSGASGGSRRSAGSLRDRVSTPSPGSGAPRTPFEEYQAHYPSCGDGHGIAIRDPDTGEWSCSYCLAHIGDLGGRTAKPVPWVWYAIFALAGLVVGWVVGGL